jgi:myo-inositol-1-phosphate synthase
MDPRSLGLILVGLGGSVGTTVAAGLELLRSGLATRDGLPLASVRVGEADGLVPYESIVVAGWDITTDDLHKAAKRHAALGADLLQPVTEALEAITPWPALEVSDDTAGARSQVDRARDDIARFKRESGVDDVVVVQVASTEPPPDLRWLRTATLEELDAAIDGADVALSSSILYCYAALAEAAPFVNFTPNPSFEFPALLALAARNRVPLAGKDGKTGQTLLKTVLAPALRARSLRVDGWYSTNLLGNSDGAALADPEARKTKIETKSGVLDAILGYAVDDHVVDICFYRPRGDDKEAWDSIDVTGFLGARMQLKVNFLCRDSLLAAPLVIELGRLMELAQRQGRHGVQAQVGCYFKAPVPVGTESVEHAFDRQHAALERWLVESGLSLR